MIAESSNGPAPGAKVLVFGGNRGIGKAIVDRLREEECVVAYSSRTPAREGHDVPFIPTDLSDPAQSGNVVSEAARLLGGLDTLVFGSAAFTPRGPMESVPLQAVKQSLHVNLLAAYAALAAAVPFLSRSAVGGRFIAISSITGGRTGLQGMAHYGMAKAGLEGLVRSGAVELASRGITVNAVEPGLIRTESLEMNYGPDRLRLMDSLIPGGRMGTPENIAAVVSWLASPGAQHVNGAVIVVDGGLTLVENPYAPND